MSPSYRRYMPNYRRGYMGRSYNVTGGHEAEAKAAERAKKPSRIGRFVFKLLGGKDPVQHAPAVHQVPPHHKHPHQHHD